MGPEGKVKRPLKQIMREDKVGMKKAIETQAREGCY